MRAVLALLAMTIPAFADGERAGKFDYYVMSLSWTPTWCALTGDARHDPQCDANAGFAFTLHGLWPQNEVGYPSYCRTSARDPSRGQTNAMADIMGSGGLAWYEWKKHGRCAGLSADQYYTTARKAYETVTVPDVFLKLHRDVTLPASVVEQAFAEVNSGLKPADMTITCDQGRVQEVRICLTKDLEPRPCGADAARDCTMPNALMEGLR